ncbi:hypothetical protein PGB90_009269 [Kerria lacca]
MNCQNTPRGGCVIVDTKGKCVSCRITYPNCHQAVLLVSVLSYHIVESNLILQNI